MTVWEYPSPLGTMVLAEEDGFLTGAWFVGQKYFPDLSAAEWKQTRVLRLASRWMDAYFAGEQPDARQLPLNPVGSEFRREVWELLLTIPYGRTTTYAALARELSVRRGVARMSAQAVGGAVGHNPVSVIIPCHRVLGADGSLTGYAGGLERKEYLLRLEQKKPE